MLSLKDHCIDVNSLPWQSASGRRFLAKCIVSQGDDGIDVSLIKLGVGPIDSLGAHNCSFGIYLINGKLVIAGAERGPGHMFWFASGQHFGDNSTILEEVEALMIVNRFEDSQLP